MDYVAGIDVGSTTTKLVILQNQEIKASNVIKFKAGKKLKESV